MPSRKPHFITLDRAIKRRMKDPTFRVAYHEELSRLKLAQELQELRCRRGLTQTQVAVRARMPQTVVARLESGRRNFSLRTLSRVAAVFDKEIGLVS